MDTTTDAKFDPAIYERVSPVTTTAMRTVEQGLSHSRGFVQALPQAFVLAPADDPWQVHNMYVDAILQSSMLKNHLLNTSMIRSVNAFDFLSYALAGRSLIEVTATLRYYFKAQIQPILHQTTQAGLVRLDQLEALIKIEDQLLRGGKFDWLSFLLRKFEAFGASNRDGQKPEGSTTTAPNGSRGRETPQPTQVRIGKCMEHWGKDNRWVSMVYGLFCDMVHPNVGSTLCIAAFDGPEITFPFDQHRSEGLTLFDRSYPVLQSLAGKEFAEVFGLFTLLKTPERGTSHN